MICRRHISIETAIVLTTIFASAGLSGVGSARADVLFQDNFNTLYSNGPANKGGTNTQLNPAAWLIAGNNNWGTVIADGSSNYMYRASVGKNAGQSATLITQSTAFGFAAHSAGITFSLDIRGVNWGNNPSATDGTIDFVIYGQNSDGNLTPNYYYANNAVAVVLTNNLVSLVVKDNKTYAAGKGSYSPTRTLWSASYSNGTIDHFDLTLTATDYKLSFDGTADLSLVAGSLNGDLDLSDTAVQAFNTAGFGLELQQTPGGGSNPRSPTFSIDIDNLRIESVPETAALSLLGAPALLLLRRRK